MLSSGPVRGDSEAWKEALSACQKLDCLLPSGYLGKVRSKGRAAVCIPAGTFKMVSATCTKVFDWALRYALYEPDCGKLPDGLLASRSFVTLNNGEVLVPIVNVETRDIWLPRRVVLGALSMAQVQSASCNKVVSFEKTNAQCTVQVQSAQTQRERHP